MRVIKLVHSYNKLARIQSHEIRSTQLWQMKMQNFSLGSCFFSEISKSDESSKNQLVISGVEHLATLSTLSKKNNKISTIEEKHFTDLVRLRKGDIFYPYEGPEDRFKNIIANEVKILFNKAVKFSTGVVLGKTEYEFFHRDPDVLIIGGGAVGLSIAYAMRSQFPHGPRITVVDKDDCFPHASTNLSQGIVTQQLFTEEEEIEILKYGAEFFSTFTRNTAVEGKEEFNLPYDPLGTLILADSSNAEEVIKRNEKMKLFGIHNKILNTSTLKEKFPWLNVDNVLFGSLGMMNEGIIDPWSYLVGLKCKAINLGINFVTAEIIDFGCEGPDIRRAVCKLPDGTFNFMEFGCCVLAGGLETLNLVNIINELDEIQIRLKLPLEERMRYEYCIYSPDGPGLNTPTVVSSDGTYFRRLGLTGHYAVGVPSVVNYEENTPFEVFHSKIKPFLEKRTPKLTKVDLVNGWIDAYDFCVSNNVGIVGPHPDTPKFIFALGFSHLGLQYLPALARGIMEYIYYDDYQTIDFTPFHIENLWRKQHLEADRRRRELLESKERIALPN